MSLISKIEVRQNVPSFSKRTTIYFDIGAGAQYWSMDLLCNLVKEQFPYYIAASLRDYAGNNLELEKEALFLLTSPPIITETGDITIYSFEPIYSTDDNVAPSLGILPGIYEKAKHPVNNDEMTVKHIIISLNDRHGWTREQVADWLETLDIDLRFSTKPPEKPKPKHSYHSFKAKYFDYDKWEIAGFITDWKWQDSKPLGYK